jgi:HD-GYP domain-containing protein (c-di-GMP phosphodiesterase class II)
LAVRLGRLVGASDGELADAYYVALLHSSGCTSDGHEQNELYGDDITPRAAFALVDPGDPAQVLGFLRAFVGANQPAEQRAAMIETAIDHAADLARQTFAMHCEVAQRFANWLGFGPGVREGLQHVFERWDGHGFPGVTGGKALPLPALLLHVARDISVFLSAGDRVEALNVLERRAGFAYEPGLAQLAARNLDELLDGIDESRIWAQALDSEPFPQVKIAGERLDSAFTAIAVFADLKSPWMREHSTRVADLAEAAAWRLDLPPAAVSQLRRAALAHDLGRVGVSNSIWEKSGPLGFGDWERVRLHPHYSERAFAQSNDLAPIGQVAGAHHERLDGTGYHRGARGVAIEQAARILAAADSYRAMREARSFRPALDEAAAEAELLREAREERLDPQAVDAVLEAAGHRVERRRRELPAGLTPRELEVLLALSLGQTNQAIADGLGISPKTVGHHVDHVYKKIDVNSRAAATLWAFEHELVQARPTA